MATGRLLALTPIARTSGLCIFLSIFCVLLYYSLQETLITNKRAIQGLGEDVGLGGSLIWALDQDDEKSSGHTALLRRDNQATTGLLSAPQTVIQNLAGSNGQNCFVYQGGCVDLNDNSAMAKACGGLTPIGWDDAGCGTKSCHCGKPICCPLNQAPKNCIWRGDNNGKGTGTDCSGQCAPGETNIKGIASSWGGGFLNDGSTNKCGRGYKIFCCPNPDFPTVTRGCAYAKCRTSCPTGQKSLFQVVDDCFFGYKQYCCPDPPELSNCHWADGDSGTFECANAKCNATEVEVDRDPYGGSQIGACSWGRSKAACCTVTLAPPKPAFCTANLCQTLAGYCPNNDDDESANNFSKRELILTSPLRESGLIPTSQLFERSALEERGSSKPYYVDLGGNIGIRILTAAYPSISELFGLRNGANILRRFFRLLPGFCVGRSINTGDIGSGDNPDITGLQTEHPIDRQIIQGFAQGSSSGMLPSGRESELEPISTYFWKTQWLANNTDLAARPPIGSRDGPQPNNPNERIMESFGSYDYPDPFLAVEASINGAKGRIMKRQDATSIKNVVRLANRAAEADTQEAADALLQSIRVGFASFEYLNTPQATQRWNMVRQQIRTQFGYIEHDLGVQNLARWWDEYTTDYFAMVEQAAQDWALRAITAAAAPFENARNNGQQPQIYGQVIRALELMGEEIDSMRLPVDPSMPITQPPGGGLPPGGPPPGGGGGGGDGGGGGGGNLHARQKRNIERS